MTNPRSQASGVFCILPWMHLTINPQGTSRICCVATKFVGNESGPYSLQRNTLEDIWNSDYMRTVRRDIAEGRRIADCSVCHRTEDEGGASQRHVFNRRWARELGPLYDTLVEESQFNDYVVSVLPLHYQLMPGNLCNLKCRMCFPVFSSQIARDRIHSVWTGGTADHQVQQAPPGELLSHELPRGPWYRDDAWVRNQLLQNADQLRGLYFTGGEPLLEKQVQNIIDYLIERDVAKNVVLQMNTNCTVVREEMIDKLLRFQRVEIGLSVDAVGAQYEYIRYPARWNVVRRNIDRWIAAGRDNWKILGGVVLQVYNLLDLVAVLDLFDSLGRQVVVEFATFPTFLNISVLPANVRALALRRLESFVERCRPINRDMLLPVISQLNGTPNRCSPESMKTIMEFTNDLDVTRRQSVRSVHPELLQLLADAGFPWEDLRRLAHAATAPAAAQSA
jgi:sulfatase maturation enzyme AslB (radical SAM superfamily)